MITYLLRDSPFTQTGSKYNWRRFPEGYTCQLSQSASRWASQLIDSAVCWRNWNPTTSEAIHLSFRRGRTKCQMQQVAYIYSWNTNLSKSFFSKHFNGNFWQAYTLTISLIIRYSVLPFYPQTLRCSGSDIVLLRITQQDYFLRKRDSLLHLKVLCGFPWIARLKLAILHWIHRGAIFSNLHVELCILRTIQKIIKQRKSGKKVFKLRNLSDLLY